MDQPPIPSHSRPTVTRLPIQLLMLLAAALLWAMRPHPELWSFVVAYGLAWFGFNLFVPSSGSIRLPWHPGLVYTLLAIAFAVPAFSVLRIRENLMSAEGFHAYPELDADRSRLQNLPAISPPTIHFDHPQSHYIHAPGATVVSLELGKGVQSLAAESLGHGLFRTWYNPRLHGILAGETGEFTAQIVADSSRTARQLTAVHFEAHPRWFTSFPEIGIAATVSEETDEVIIVSRATLRHRIATDDGPSDCALYADGTRLAVTHRYSENMSVFDVESGSLSKTVKLARFQHRISAAPAGGDFLAVAMAGTTPEIRFLDGDTLEIESTVPLPFPPDWIAFGPDENSLLVTCATEGNLRRLDRVGGSADWKISEPLAFGSPPITLSRSPDGTQLYLALADYQPAATRHGNHFIQDQILTVDVATLQVLAQRFTAGRDDHQDSPGSTNRGVSPMAIAPIAGTESSLITFAGSDEIWQIDLARQLPPRVWQRDALAMNVPHGVADLGQGAFAVSSAVDGRITIIGGSEPEVTFDFARHSDSAFPDSAQSIRIRKGERAFHETTRAGISCQSCHTHTGTDHAIRNIGQEVPSYTLTARGVAGTTPYLRDASYARIRDLNYHVAENLYRGYLRYDPDREFNLETFVETLPRTVNPMAFDPPKLERDRSAVDLFVKADCTLCHPFPAFTNLSQHPIRTIFPDFGEMFPPAAIVDTPTLIGLWDKKRFLQDGRAGVLEEVFTEFNIHNRHGNTTALTEAEKRTLAEFLRSL